MLLEVAQHLVHLEAVVNMRAATMLGLEAVSGTEDFNVEGINELYDACKFYSKNQKVYRISIRLFMYSHEFYFCKQAHGRSSHEYVCLIFDNSSLFMNLFTELARDSLHYTHEYPGDQGYPPNCQCGLPNLMDCTELDHELKGRR